MVKTVIYTTENSKFNKLTEEALIETVQIIARNIKNVLAYSNGMDRASTSKIREVFSIVLRKYNCTLEQKSSHAYGIGNNNAWLIIDNDNATATEDIGEFHCNSGMFGEAYMSIYDLNNNRKTNCYETSERGIKIFKKY